MEDVTITATIVSFDPATGQARKFSRSVSGPPIYEGDMTANLEQRLVFDILKEGWLYGRTLSQMTKVITPDLVHAGPFFS